MSIQNPKETLPPSPPLTDKGESDTSSVNSEDDGGCIPLPPVSVVPKEILPVDLASPDKHVPRDPRLIRLTGNHPFNCEAPLTDLFEAGCPFENCPLIVGFLTPPELFYVRNHGAVPQVLDEEILNWEVSIEG
jgi:nitrate reductase (NAD(P)H)